MGKFVPEGELCFIQNIERSKVLSLVSDKEEETSVTEMFMEPKGLKQLWQIGTPNEDGFFTITEPLSKKVLHASGTSKLKINDPLIRVQKPHQMWKLVDASSQKLLINQAENWDSKDNWEFKENGAYISIQNISKNQVIPIVLTIDADSDKIKEEEFIENFPPQQWIKGDPNSIGFFTLTHLSTKKV